VSTVLNKGENMSEKAFIEKTEEVNGYTVALDWSMGKYGVYVFIPGTESSERWQSEIYEFDNESDAQNTFDFAVELLKEFI
jgi:aryl-alcohol dehydrogenase-like predicted oxidoreductase